MFATEPILLHLIISSYNDEVYYFLVLVSFLVVVFYKAKSDPNYIGVARGITTFNMLLACATLGITFVSKETIIGYSFLMYVVPVQFAIACLEKSMGSVSI